MLDEQWIERDPIASVHPAAKGRLGLLRRAGADDPEPVRDAVNVRVDRDPRDPVAENEHAVRGLRSDGRKALELLQGPGDDPAVSVDQLARARDDRPSLGVVEPRPADERFDLGRARHGEELRARVLREEPSAGDVGRLIARPLGEDRADEHLERVFGVIAQVRHPPVTAPVECAEPIEDLRPGEGRDRAHRRSAGGSGRPGSERSGSSTASGVLARRSSPTR